MTGTRRRRLELAGAAACAVLAVLLLVLAVDVLRWQRGLGAADVGFDATPRSGAQGRWAVDGALPSSLEKLALRVGDDLDYREAIQLFARVEPGQVQIFGPQLENLYSTAQVEVGRIGRVDPDAARRSRALNLAGVFQVGRQTSPSNQVTDSAERLAVLRQAIGLFQAAVRLDDTNEDAKLNLELVLRDAGAAVLSGDVPNGNAAEGERSGAGRAGSGY
jgi:hypothetical protein